MDNKQDIYSSPSRDKKQDEDLPIVDLQTGTARAAARRRTLGFSVFMIVVLGLAIWLFVTFEARQKESYEALIEEADKSLKTPTETEKNPKAELRPEVVAPDINDIAEELRAPRTAALSSLDRQKLGKAMGEVRIANQYLQEQDWEHAEIHAYKALELWPEMPVAMRLLGFVYMQRGQFNEAVAVLENVLDREPFSAETFNNLASAYMQKFEFTRAEELLNTALQIRPDFTVAHMNLGLLYVISGQYELTIDHLEYALTFSPDNIPARNNLSVALIRVGRYNEAREQLHRIIETEPGRAKAYFNIAITYVLEREADKALEWIRKGASRCTPIKCRTYLTDSDFDPLRNHPAFQEFMQSLFPELPTLPEG